MSKIKIIPKLVPISLIVSILFTACDVPDISEFTTQSVEMTRGIRQGVKDTGDVLKTAAANDSLFEPETIRGFQKYSKSYNTVMQPTLKTLDALDSYVEALNALAQANKKSAENSEVLVGAIDDLVSSARNLVVAPPLAAFELPDMALKGRGCQIQNSRAHYSGEKYQQHVYAGRERLIKPKSRFLWTDWPLRSSTVAMRGSA